jgi:hypothetical protein
MVQPGRVHAFAKLPVRRSREFRLLPGYGYDLDLQAVQQQIEITPAGRGILPLGHDGRFDQRGRGDKDPPSGEKRGFGSRRLAARR